MEIEKILDDRDLIVSATDKKGIILYANRTFSRISEYSKDELYGEPHNILRHPDMPKAAFRHVWNTLLSHKPIVAYVKNMVKGREKFYWVKAVMYPKIVNNDVESITSYRTKATQVEIDQISVVYEKLIEYEKTHTVEESYAFFLDFLKSMDLTYDKLINRLNDHQQILNEALLKLDITEVKTEQLILRSRIESLVEKGYENIEVPNPNDSEFGKKLISMERESFANDSRFLNIRDSHKKIYSNLQAYVDSDEDRRGILMDSIYSDIDSLCRVMEDLKNDHRV